MEKEEDHIYLTNKLTEGKRNKTYHVNIMENSNPSLKEKWKKSHARIPCFPSHLYSFKCQTAMSQSKW